MTRSTTIELSGEQRIQKAAELFEQGQGDEDVAVAIYGRSDGFTLAAARGLRLEVQSRAGGR